MGQWGVVLVDLENVQAIDFSSLGEASLIVFVGEGQKKIPIELAMGLQALGEKGRWVRASGTGPNALDFHIAFELGRMIEAGEKGPAIVLSRDKGFDPLLTWLNTEFGVPARRVESLDEAFKGPTHASDPPVKASEHSASPAPESAALQKEWPAGPEAKGPSAKPMPAQNTKASKAQPAVKPSASKAEKAAGKRPSAELAREILARSQKVARPRRRVTLAKHIEAMFKAHAIADREVQAIIAKLLANRSISDNEGAISYHF